MALASAKYKLKDHSPERIVYEHRFMPQPAKGIAIGLLLLMIFFQSTGPSTPAFIALAWICVGALAFYRRKENLTLSLRPDGSGTAITVAGQASEKARQVLDSRLPA